MENVQELVLHKDVKESKKYIKENGLMEAVLLTKTNPEIEYSFKEFAIVKEDSRETLNIYDDDFKETLKDFYDSISCFKFETLIKSFSFKMIKAIFNTIDTSRYYEEFAVRTLTSFIDYTGKLMGIVISMPGEDDRVIPVTDTCFRSVLNDYCEYLISESIAHYKYFLSQISEDSKNSFFDPGYLPKV